jgi:5-methylcytosine-specific restriction endonuclease McrA
MIRGGTHYSQSKAFKDVIRERDNHTCQICGKPGRDVDHIVPYHLSHETRPDGVRVLCHRCNLIGRRNTRQAPPYDQWIANLQLEHDIMESW